MSHVLGVTLPSLGGHVVELDRFESVFFAVAIHDFEDELSGIFELERAARPWGCFPRTCGPAADERERNEHMK
jgi:hypothetical protein